jgi:hypothetical protein
MRLRLVLAATPLAATLAAPSSGCVTNEVSPPRRDVTAIEAAPSPSEDGQGSAPFGASWADFQGPLEGAAVP